MSETHLAISDDLLDHTYITTTMKTHNLRVSQIRVIAEIVTDLVKPILIRKFLKKKEREEKWVTSETSKSIRKWMKELEEET